MGAGKFSTVFLLLFTTIQAAAFPGRPVFVLRIRLMNRAGVPAGVVAGIQREAERVLGHAGIQMQLRNCVPVMGLLPRSCEEPAAPAEVLLELLPGHAVRRQVLGYAQPGSYAAVFLGRAEDLARAEIATRNDILAHVVVHEAVHMVTGARQHAASGVMHAVWGPEDLRRIATRSENLTPKEGAEVRAALARSRAGPR